MRDDPWERIRHLLPGKPGDPGAIAKDNRLFVEAVLYRDRAGIPWWDLPQRYGDFRVQMYKWRHLIDAIFQNWRYR